jgi:hypothetical protein
MNHIQARVIPDTGQDARADSIDAVRLSASMAQLELTVRPLAIALGTSRRTVQRWLDGSAPVPAGIWTELAALAAKRSG